MTFERGLRHGSALREPQNSRQPSFRDNAVIVVPNILMGTSNNALLPED
jgi:hypothetical protein